MDLLPVDSWPELVDPLLLRPGLKKLWLELESCGCSKELIVVKPSSETVLSEFSYVRLVIYTDLNTWECEVQSSGTNSSQRPWKLGDICGIVSKIPSENGFQMVIYRASLREFWFSSVNFCNLSKSQWKVGEFLSVLKNRFKFWIFCCASCGQSTIVMKSFV